MPVPDDLPSGTDDQAAPRHAGTLTVASVGLVLGGVSLWAVLVAALYSWARQVSPSAGYDTTNTQFPATVPAQH